MKTIRTGSFEQLLIHKSFLVMKTKRLFTLFTTLIAFTAFGQNVITVDNSVGANAQYSDLQSAIDNASSGDTIYIHASELSYGNATIDKQLKLVGYGHSNTIKNTYLGSIILEDNASGSEFTGLYVLSGIDCQNSVTVINDLVFENCRFYALSFGSSFYAGCNNVLVKGCVVPSISGFATNMIITNNVLTRVYIDENYQSVTIRNNFFFHPSSGSPNCIINYSSANGSITAQNNIFYYTSASSSVAINVAGVIYEYCLSYTPNGTYEIMNGSNNLDNVNPLFVNVINNQYEADIDDFHLQAGSPAIGAGVNGFDIGLYDGNAFEFNNFGFTPGIPTVTITAITEQVAPGDNVEVTIQSNSN